MYLGRYANQLGSPLWVDPELNMYHERQDIFSPISKGTEKRLLELTAPILHRSFSSAWAVLPFTVRAALMGSYRKAKKILKYRKTMSLGFWETLAGLPVILAILVYDAFLILSLAFWHPFLLKTLHYQGGEKWGQIHRFMARVTPKRFRSASGSPFSRESWPSRKVLRVS
jgi:hypothetical protein